MSPDEVVGYLLLAWCALWLLAGIACAAIDTRPVRRVPSTTHPATDRSPRHARRD